uniref:Uncharacterized protein n=1 Tax=Glossina palpalis gambiensis TaxID=67801 RepID=A0A1B0BVI5_9MUSC
MTESNVMVKAPSVHERFFNLTYDDSTITEDDGSSDQHGCYALYVTIAPSVHERFFNLTYDDSTITEDDGSSDQHGCYALYVTIEMDSVIKSSSLEIDNNSVTKRHQRPGIVVAGFPASLDNVVGVVIKIEFALNVNISPNDITTCDLLKKQNRLIKC